MSIRRSLNCWRTAKKKSVSKRFKIIFWIFGSECKVPVWNRKSIVTDSRIEQKRVWMLNGPWLIVDRYKEVIMKKLVHEIDQHFEEWLLTFFLGAMAVIMLLQVVMRYVFKSALAWAGRSLPVFIHMELFPGSQLLYFAEIRTSNRFIWKTLSRKSTISISTVSSADLYMFVWIFVLYIFICNITCIWDWTVKFRSQNPHVLGIPFHSGEYDTGSFSFRPKRYKNYHAVKA